MKAIKVAIIAEKVFFGNVATFIMYNINFHVLENNRAGKCYFQSKTYDYTNGGCANTD